MSKYGWSKDGGYWSYNIGKFWLRLEWDYKQRWVLTISNREDRNWEASCTFPAGIDVETAKKQSMAEAENSIRNYLNYAKDMLKKNHSDFKEWLKTETF